MSVLMDIAIELKTDVKKNLAAVLDRIQNSTMLKQKSKTLTSLVAVSKTQSIEKIEIALKAGHRIFGENRIQEATSKWPDLKIKYSGTELHLIGPLQTNKVKEAVSLFDVIETVDRQKLAIEIKKEIVKQGVNIRCYVQVNTGEEEQKAGILPAEAENFVNYCQDTIGLTIDGLMCIPPVNEEPALHFTLLTAMGERLGIRTFSMGMSDDFETAIQFGATHVRIGSSIFGKRDSILA